MKKRKKVIRHFVAVTVFVFCFMFGSCATARIDHSYSLSGITQNINNLPLKDFVPVGIVFVNSTEVIDSLGNHTGSKITYEMFMREAARLQAHDVINIRIDVTRRVEQGQRVGGNVATVTTYIYTGTALAIRYTDAIVSVCAENPAIQSRHAVTASLSNTDVNRQTITSRGGISRQSREPRVGQTRVNWLSGGVSGVFGGIYTTMGFDLRYERDINDILSLGGTVFFSSSDDERDTDFGISAAARYSPWSFPFYFELGLGIGSMWDGIYWENRWWDGGYQWSSGYIGMYNTGLLLTPAVGVKLGGQTNRFFVNPFLSVPMVIGEAFSSRFIPGVSVGAVW